MKIKIQTVSLHLQTAGSAPGDVTVVTAEEIRKYGYRTFGEVLNHVRGFYLSYDHTYYQLGVAGFSVPGDWATRILVLVNGHAMPDNVFGAANYFGEDFVVDMSLVDRIEIVRGPSSALYGSNGVLATVNVITKTPSTEHGTKVNLETDSLGEAKATVTQSVKLPHQNSLLLSTTFLNIDGMHDIYIPELASSTSDGHAINMDGSHGYRFFAEFQSGNWEILAVAGSRTQVQPVSWSNVRLGDTILNDRGTRATDQRAFLDALYTRDFGSERTLHWRTYYDRYQYHGIYYFPLDDSGIDVNKEFDAGDWIGSQLNYRFPWLKGSLTVGTEAKFDLRAVQSTADVQPVFVQNFYVNRLDKYAAGFLQQEWSPGPRWSFNFGVRYDWSWYRSSAVSPRGAIIFQPDKQTALKMLYGRGFRNPNANELFFNDGISNIANLNLQPEHADTFQAVAERAFHRSWKASVSAYEMVDRGIIVPVYTEDGLIQFQNANHFHGKGIGVELSGTVFSKLELSADFEKQKAYFYGGATPANSPGDVGKLRMALPVLSSRATVSGGLLYMSERRTLAGAILPPVYLPEATVSMRKLLPGMELQAGVRNFTNMRYSDPIGLTPTVDTIRQPGRTFFIALNTSFGH